MGLKFTRQFSKKRMKNQRTDGSLEDDGGEGEDDGGEDEQDEAGEDETDGKAVAGGSVNHHVRALYGFHGSNEDEVRPHIPCEVGRSVCEVGMRGSVWEVRRRERVIRHGILCLWGFGTSGLSMGPLVWVWDLWF